MKPQPKNIEHGRWWDEAWTLTRGCSHVSAGCDHCWAERMSHMRRNHPNVEVRNQYGMTDDSGKWTGRVETLPLNLGTPIRRKKPTVYAVWNDLFHPDIPWNFIFDVFKRMAFCPQHTFLILTKRPERMPHALSDVAFHMGRNFPDKQWPLPNVWLGVTAENQEQANIRVPELLRTPAAVRFVSHEPALGTIAYPPEFLALGGRALVITGGETGPGARPMHPDIPRNDRDQCVAAGVAFWYKQWGEYAPAMRVNLETHTSEEIGHGAVVKTPHAGRLLDGRTWNEWPEDK